jgi:hypothetical protein
MSNRRISPTSVAASTEIPDCHDSDVQGLPRSALRDFTRRLTVVPAGHGLSRPLKLRALTDTTYFYIDPREGLRPIRRCDSARSNSHRAYSSTITISGRPLSSSDRWSRIRARCRGNTPKRSATCWLIGHQILFHGSIKFETTCTGAKRPCTPLHKPYIEIAPASSARAASIALWRASGPKANFSARTKAILVMPIKPNRFRR